MANVPREDDAEHSRILLGLLESVERNGAQTQRHLASELGIALGLVNAYLKRCVKKGLVKVSEAPVRRYAYYLTPKGFAEKSRLTIDYLSYSFSFFRQARSDCAEVLAAAKGRGWNRIVLIGKSDLAEIARLCAIEIGIEIVAVVEPQTANSSVEMFVGVPVSSSLDAISAEFDGAVITDLRATNEMFEAAVAHLGRERVLAPSLLGVRSNAHEEVAP